MSHATAQALLVSSLIDVIDCDRQLQILKVEFRGKVEPATWSQIIQIEAQRAQTIGVALAVWDTAAIFPVGSGAEARARQLLERDDSWTLDTKTMARRPDLARADRQARKASRHPHRSGLD